MQSTSKIYYTSRDQEKKISIGEEKILNENLTCCEIGHDKHHLSKSRNHITGRYQEKGIHQKDIPEQCYLCKQGVHHECNKPEECGCDCADFIEDTTELGSIQQ